MASLLWTRTVRQGQNNTNGSLYSNKWKWRKVSEVIVNFLWNICIFYRCIYVGCLYPFANQVDQFVISPLLITELTRLLSKIYRAVPHCNRYIQATRLFPWALLNDKDRRLMFPAHHLGYTGTRNYRWGPLLSASTTASACHSLCKAAVGLRNAPQLAAILSSGPTSFSNTIASDSSRFSQHPAVRLLIFLNASPSLKCCKWGGTPWVLVMSMSWGLGDACSWAEEPCSGCNSHGWALSRQGTEPVGPSTRTRPVPPRPQAAQTTPARQQQMALRHRRQMGRGHHHQSGLDVRLCNAVLH